MAWEYQDVTVSFGNRFAKLKPLSDVWKQMFSDADQIIAQYLEKASADGWEPDSPVHFRDLLDNDRVNVKLSFDFIAMPSFTYTDARIRLKRSVR